MELVDIFVYVNGELAGNKRYAFDEEDIAQGFSKPIEIELEINLLETRIYGIMINIEKR